MAYDQGLAQRIREQCGVDHDCEEKKMFGGLVFMLNGHMVVGVLRDALMLRVGKEQYGSVLSLPGAAPMEFTGKPMSGFVVVSSDYCVEDEELKHWMSYALNFVLTLPPK